MTATGTPTSKPIVTALEEDAKFWFLGVETWLRTTTDETNGALGLVEHVLPPGFASPYHLHHGENEAFYVIEGTLQFISGERSWLAGPGGFAFLPREIPHGFRVEGRDAVRVLLFTMPGGFEGFVADLGAPAPPDGPPDLGKVMQVAARYNVEILGPLPD